MAKPKNQNTNADGKGKLKTKLRSATEIFGYLQTPGAEDELSGCSEFQH
jgi:hypothetical protein